MVRVIYGIIKDLVKDLPEDLVDQFFEKIKTVPQKQYNEMFLTFLKDFTQKALETYYDTQTNDMSIHEGTPMNFESLVE